MESTIEPNKVCMSFVSSTFLSSTLVAKCVCPMYTKVNSIVPVLKYHIADPNI